MTMIAFDFKDIILISTLFLLLGVLLVLNLSLVFAAAEEWYERYNDADITFYYKHVEPICSMYIKLGLMEPLMNCNEWYKTDEGKQIVTKYLLNNQ